MFQPYAGPAGKPGRPSRHCHHRNRASHPRTLAPLDHSIPPDRGKASGKGSRFPTVAREVCGARSGSPARGPKRHKERTHLGCTMKDHRPLGKRPCPCGRTAFRWLGGSFVCERCYAIEKRMDEKAESRVKNHAVEEERGREAGWRAKVKRGINRGYQLVRDKQRAGVTIL